VVGSVSFVIIVKRIVVNLKKRKGVIKYYKMKKDSSELNTMGVRVCYGRVADNFCAVCGARSRVKLFFEIRKGSYYTICTECFSNHRSTPIGELKKLIKNNHL
tara:strand:+ start:309 stop:617 length:309 start_codon:yes stop_codon:yes gene_type:complete